MRPTSVSNAIVHPEGSGRTDRKLKILANRSSSSAGPTMSSSSVSTAASGVTSPTSRSLSGRGDLVLADDADEIHLITLEGDSVTVNGRNVLAFDSTGTGQVAITAHGTPVVRTVDAPAFADMQAAVAWSSSLATSARRTAGAGALIGRGSGEAFQLACSGTGFVVVQASEGHVVPRHSR